MTLVIAFHGSGYRTFKDFYKQKVLADWRDAFPNWVSYGRFVELIPWSLMALVSFLNTRCLGEVTGTSILYRGLKGGRPIALPMGLSLWTWVG